MFAYMRESWEINDNAFEIVLFSQFHNVFCLVFFFSFCFFSPWLYFFRDTNLCICFFFSFSFDLFRIKFYFILCHIAYETSLSFEFTFIYFSFFIHSYFYEDKKKKPFIAFDILQEKKMFLHATQRRQTSTYENTYMRTLAPDFIL